MNKINFIQIDLSKFLKDHVALFSQIKIKSIKINIQLLPRAGISDDRNFFNRKIILKMASVNLVSFVI